MAGEPDRERRAGERAEVLMPRNETSRWPGRLPSNSLDDAEELEQAPDARRRAPADEHGEEAVEVDAPPEEQHGGRREQRVLERPSRR